jgi:hypothetical protein
MYLVLKLPLCIASNEQIQLYACCSYIPADWYLLLPSSASRLDRLIMGTETTQNWLVHVLSDRSIHPGMAPRQSRAVINRDHIPSDSPGRKAFYACRSFDPVRCVRQTKSSTSLSTCSRGHALRLVGGRVGRGVKGCVCGEMEREESGEVQTHNYPAKLDSLRFDGVREANEGGGRCSCPGCSFDWRVSRACACLTYAYRWKWFRDCRNRMPTCHRKQAINVSILH